MNTYCLNLRSRPDRWSAVQDECKKLDLNVMRVGAIRTTLGWEGCKASHIQLLQHAKDEGIFMIIEDDMKVIGSKAEYEKSLLELPDDWDMLYLGASFPAEAPDKLVKYTDSLCYLQGGLCTHALLFNNQHGVADWIINNQKGLFIDQMYMKFVQPKFNCYITYPMIATQQEGYSDITHKHTDYSEITDSYKKRTR